MKRTLIVFSLAALVMFSLGAGAKKGMTNNSPFGFLQTTYANSIVDTLTFPRPPGMTAMSFSANWFDSVSITRVVVRREVGGEWLAVQAGDTLTGFSPDSNFVAGINGSTANPSGAMLNTVTLAPMPGVYVFIVTYASTRNGVTNPKVYYRVHWQRSY